MVESPAVGVAVEVAEDWSAEGPSAERALAVAQRVAPDRPHRIVVGVCPPEHIGLGVGTQLSLAVARAIIGPETATAELARLAGRGNRSGIGVHGFERGGFLVDGGKREGDELAPLIVLAEFPADWRIVLLTPKVESSWHGDRERAAFAAMNAAQADDALCRLVLLGMLPALAEHDLPSFGEALHEYNRRSGEPFRSSQGGAFAPESAAVIDWLRGQEIAGVGQSSWGPTVFAVVEDAERAAAVAESAQKRLRAAVEVTAARNRGVD
jgi:beta-RFAP synthase